MLPTALIVAILLVGLAIGITVIFLTVTVQTTVYNPSELATHTHRTQGVGPHGRWQHFNTTFGNTTLVILTGSETTDGSGLSPVINIPNVGAVVAAFFAKTGVVFGQLQHVPQGPDGDVQFVALDAAGGTITGSIDYEAYVYVLPE